MRSVAYDMLEHAAPYRDRALRGAKITIDRAGNDFLDQDLVERLGHDLEGGVERGKGREAWAR